MAAPPPSRTTRREKGERNIAKNRRAPFDYLLEDHYEAGLILVGSEVKSLRDGKVEIVDAFGIIDRGECWLMQLYIAPFAQASVFNHEPRRRRKLLLHRSELAKLGDALKDRGYTIIPTRMYFKDGRAKIEIALARGKNKGDKRQAIAKKDAERETRDAIGRARKGRA
ncbi:MAG: SsrA-binding protein SmpB [Polyangiales bacterium]